tara:strand:- start:2927 stop:3568 length:642 start_codon:yes stop_codon:yes gene_type:complete
MDLSTRSEIWQKLSGIDVSTYCTEKEILNDKTIFYLPVMRAHEIMMNNFPEYNWEFSEDPAGREVHYFDDGSAEVRCRMTIGSHTNTTYLAVHAFGEAIIAPNSMQIHVAKQRARVKALGEFGLGYKMWLDSESVPKMLGANPAEVRLQAISDEIDGIEAMWAKAKAIECTNREAGLKVYNRFAKWLMNQGMDDPQQNRWADLCKFKGWKINK